MIKATKSLRVIGKPFDVFIYAENEFSEHKNDFGSIADVAPITGRELNL